MPLAFDRCCDDEVVAWVRNREFEAEAAECRFVPVTRLVAFTRSRSETEEAARERFFVAAPDFEEAALFLKDPASREFSMVESSAPGQLVGLLTFCGVGKEETREFTSALLAEVEIGEREPSAETNVAVAKEERSHEARDEKSLEDIAGLEPPLRDVAPAFGVRQVRGLLDLWNSPVLFDSLPRIKFPGRRLCDRRPAEKCDCRKAKDELEGPEVRRAFWSV